MGDVVHFTYAYEHEHTEETYWCSVPLPEEVRIENIIKDVLDAIMN